MTILRCDPCSKGNCSECKHWVRAFIEPDGPQDYQCECYCERNRVRKDAGDRSLRSVISGYKRAFGDIELQKILKEYAPEPKTETRTRITTIRVGR